MSLVPRPCVFVNDVDVPLPISTAYLTNDAGTTSVENEAPLDPFAVRIWPEVAPADDIAAVPTDPAAIFPLVTALAAISPATTAFAAICADPTAPAAICPLVIAPVEIDALPMSEFCHTDAEELQIKACPLELPEMFTS